MAKKTLEELKKKYDIGGSSNTTTKSETGKQNHSSASNKKSLEELKKKYGIGEAKKSTKPNISKIASTSPGKSISKNKVTEASTKPQNNTTHIKQEQYYPNEESDASGWEIAGNSVMSGLGTFNKGLFSTLDFILPTEFLGKYDFISNLNEYYSNQDNYYKQKKAESLEGKSTATKILADVGEGTVAATPNAVLALMSGGASAGTTLGTTAPASTGFFSALGNTAKTAIKNPMYWTSMAQTLGTDYEEAKANGANEFVATATAFIKSGINAGLEIGGGIETLPLKSGDTSLIKNWVTSLLEEGQEEVVQGVVSASVDKIMYEHDKEIASLTDENAIFNPQRMAKEFGMGAAVGGVLGGAQTGIIAGADALARARFGNPVQNETAIEQPIEEQDTLEKVAMDVVNERNRTSTPIYESLEALSQKNEPITVDEVKKATGFGDNGAKLVTELASQDGMTFMKASDEMKKAYLSGYRGEDITFTDDLQNRAKLAGIDDRISDNNIALERAKNAVVNEKSGFYKANLPSDVTKRQADIIDLMAKGLGYKTFVAKGLKGNAEINHDTGEVAIDFNFQREIGSGNNKQKVSIVFHAAHEMALHGVVNRAPEEGKAFVYAMYKHLAGNESLLGSTLADQKRNAYAKQDVNISLAEAMEEISANNILYLYGNNEVKFQKAMESIVNGNDVKAKQGLQKYIDYLTDFIKKIGEFLKGKTKAERAEIQAELDEVRKLRDMFETAVAKAVENKKTVEKADAERRVANEVVVDNATTSKEDGKNFSIREDYADKIDIWNKCGKPDGETFVLGVTGDVLQGLGAIESDIYMLGDKIKEILATHPEMTIDEIKKIPQILENPVLILKSKNEGRGKKQNTRLVIFGNIKAQDGRPILSILDLRPIENNLVVDDMQKVSSAYTKDVDPVNFVKSSFVVYVDKKRTTKLLRTIGFKMPIELQRSGYIGSISYKGQNVNIFGETFEKVFREKDVASYSLKGTVVEGELASLVKKYGAIQRGEKPHREIQVPKKTEKNKNVSQTVRTILEAKATPDEMLPTIAELVTKGEFSYDVYTNKEAISNAEENITKKGWETAKADWYKSVGSGEVSKKNTAEGWVIYNNAVNSGDVETALEVLNFMVKHQRSAAQALQATRILKKLSPETQLYGVQKSVQALQNELTDKYGDKAPDLKIDEELAEQFINAKTPEERAEIEKEIYKDIGRQMPSRFIDKWNAWRYLAMLGNARTHIRNLVGNAGFAPVVLAKNLTATAIESVVHRVSGKKTLRGKSLVWGSKTDRALLKAAWDDYSIVADLISNGGKYNDSAMANQQIEEGRQIFKSKPLEWARKKNSQLLETEDMWFAKPHYAFALAQYCKANNITAEQIQKGKAIGPARDYAIKEAQKATYRDTNAFSQFVSSLGRKGEIKYVPKVVSMAVEGVLPFRKTPANILVRGVEYSPIGLLKSLSYDLRQVSKGKMSATEVIDNISAGLTGTGLLALGVLLAAQGLIRGHGEDEEEKGFKELMGHQAYALELPSGQSITLDWLAPEALPFFVGVNLWETTRGTNEELNLSAILQAVSGITEPMIELSCLQGVNDIVEGIGYASSNDTSVLVAIASSAIKSYFTQGIPTLFGQTERTGEENRMTTFTEKNSFLTGDMQYTLGRASAKIPIWDYNQIPYIDAWGRKEASGTALKRGINNFLNPAYTSTIETSKMEEELLRLYDETGEGGVFPTRADKYFTVDGERKDLTADEYVRYATLKGEKSYTLVSDLVKSKAYKKLSDAEKVKALKETYDYANQKAKQAISNYKPETWVSKADEFGSDVGNYISFKTEVSGIKEDNGGKISKQEVVDIILDMAQNDSETWKMYLSMYDSESDKYAYNKGVQGQDYMDFLVSLDKYDKPTKTGKYGTYTQEEVKKAIDNMQGLSRKEKSALYQSVNTGWKNNPYRQ